MLAGHARLIIVGDLYWLAVALADSIHCGQHPRTGRELPSCHVPSSLERENLSFTSDALEDTEVLASSTTETEAQSASHT